MEPPANQALSPTSDVFTETVYGIPTPRLFTPPLRPLTPETTRGYEVIEFARNVLKEPLLPWQEEAVIRAMELNTDGTYRFRTVVILVARQNGKSHLSKVVALYKMYVDNAKLVLGVAQDLSIAKEVWLGAVEIATDTPELAHEVLNVRYANGEQELSLLNGARYKISAASRSAGRGLTVDHLTLDEIREHRNFDAWSALSKTTNARACAQTWTISNAGDAQSVVLNQLRDAALSGRDESIGLLEWSAPDGCALEDVEGWRQANPALGHTLSIQAIRSALATDTPNVFRTEILCQRVDALDAAIEAAAWNALVDSAGSLADYREQISLCLDVSLDGAHATLVAAAQLSDGRVRVEPIAVWSNTEDIKRELPELIERIAPVTFSFFPLGGAAAIAPFLRSHGGVEIKGTKVSEACIGLADLVQTRQILHPGDPLIDAHIIGAQKYQRGDGWVFVRRGVGHVDAAYAVAGAVYALFSAEPPERIASFGIY
ncbi:terminase [Amycolatopsis japonica]|uniref:terminase n=1 Tax=Amycolatopsis japonica TaxID=208439 RepID=UPI0037B6E41D